MRLPSLRHLHREAVLEQREHTGLGEHAVGDCGRTVGQGEEPDTGGVDAAQPGRYVRMCRELGEPGQHLVDGIGFVDP